MALLAAAKFKYGASISLSAVFYMSFSTFINLDTSSFNNLRIIHCSWAKASEATCSSGFPARIGTDSPIVRESRKGRHCEAFKPGVVRIEGVKHPDLIAYFPFYTKDSLRYWACGKDTISWSFWLRSWSARAVFHVVFRSTSTRVLF